MKIKTKDFLSYVEGWLSTEVSDRGFLTMESMKSALSNSLAMLEDDQDGIKAHIKQQDEREKSRKEKRERGLLVNIFRAK